MSVLINNLSVRILNYIKKNYAMYSSLIVLPIPFAFGVLSAYFLYFSEYLNYSEVNAYFYLILLILSLLGSIIMFIDLVKINRLFNRISKVFFIGLTLGLFAPVLLGRPTLINDIFNFNPKSEIYSLELFVTRIEEASLANKEGIDSNYHNTITEIGNGKFLLLSSPNSPRINFNDQNSQNLFYPESILTLFELGSNNELDFISSININSKHPNIIYTKDIFFSEGYVYLTNIGVSQEGCVSLQLWQFSFSFNEVISLGEPLKLFQSSPNLCSGTAISLVQAGGRIIKYDDENLLLSVGDFRLGAASVAEESTGYTSRPDEMIYPNSYGMIIKISLVDYSWKSYSTGHRNPQGLYLDELNGNLWSTEHGPRSGDELNLITEGFDYGWPVVTYGIPYGQNLPLGDWDFDRWNNHEGFTKPTFSWFPAVAPSQLLIYRGEEFQGWDGNLLVSTLGNMSIRRLKLVDSRVVYDEQIYIGKRIRDLILLSDGKLLMSFDSGEIGILSLSKD